MLVDFKIHKFNPGTDSKPYLRDYQVELSERATVLDALYAIKEQQDGTLSFRASCRSSICGSCAMRINGAAKLACKTRVVTEVAARGSVKVEPLQFPVIKDLIVDMELFWKMMEKVKPWLIPDPNETPPERERLATPETTPDVMRNSLCIMCACCHSDCNAKEVEPEFIGPAAFARADRYISDVRDGATEGRLKMMNEQHGIWECVRCFICTQVCPKGVDPRESIRRIGHTMFDHDITSDPGARHAQAFQDSTRISGRLNEATLPLKTRILGSLEMTPTAIRMILKGKIPIPIQKPVPDVDEIRKIFDLTEKKK